MARLDALKRRVKVLEDQLDRQLVDVEVLTGRMDSTQGAEYDQVAEGLALARMKTDVMRESLDKAKDSLKSAEAEVQSSEYQDAFKRMDAIKKDVTKAEKAITKTYDTLRSQLDEVYDLCEEHDRLNRRYRGVASPWLMPSYRWLTYLHSRMSKLLRDDKKIR